MPVPVRNDTRTSGSTLASVAATLRLRGSGVASSERTAMKIPATKIDCSGSCAMGT